MRLELTPRPLGLGSDVGRIIGSVVIGLVLLGLLLVGLPWAAAVVFPGPLP